MGYFEIGGPIIITLKDGTKVDLIDDSKAAAAGDKAAQERLLKMQKEQNDARGLPTAATYEEELAAQRSRARTTSPTPSPGTSSVLDRAAGALSDLSLPSGGSTTQTPMTPPTTGTPPSIVTPAGQYPALPPEPSMFTPGRVALIAGGVGLLALAGYMVMNRKKAA